MSQNLEDSPLWKQSLTLTKELRATIKGVFRYDEHYTFADPLERNAIQLTSDIASALGKGSEALVDYQYARGHLFSIKGLVLVAQEYGYLKDVASLLTDMELMHRAINHEIERLEDEHEAKL